MNEVDVFIWFDENGKICAVGHASEDCAELVEPLAKESHRIHRVRLPLERLGSLHLTHRIDPARIELVEQARRAES
jgi:hypothetical protein